MEEEMETIIMGSIGTTIRIHSSLPSWPKVSIGCTELPFRGQWLSGLFELGTPNESSSLRGS